VVISFGCVPTRRPHVSGQDVLPLRRDTSQDCQITWLQRRVCRVWNVVGTKTRTLRLMSGKNLDQDQTLYCIGGIAATQVPKCGGLFTQVLSMFPLGQMFHV